MINQELNNCRVYSVLSLEEAKKILLDNDNFEIKNFVKRAFVRVWRFGANISLSILKFLLFKKTGYKKREYKNIVVYTVGIVGDNVVMLSAMAVLRKRYKDAFITVITNCQTWDQQGAREVLEPSPYKDRLIILDDHPVRRNGFKFKMDRKKFEDVKCDLFINLSPFGNRGWFGAVVKEMIFAKKLGAKYAIGYSMSTYSRKGIFNKVQHYFIKNEPRRSEEVLRKLGLAPIYNTDLMPRDDVARKSILKKLEKLNTSNKILFVINPGSKFETKCWLSENYAGIIKWIMQKYDAAVVITGIASERSVAESIRKESDDSVLNLAGETSINELVELIRLGKACVTNDTGTMHISAMVGIPTVAIFTSRLSPTHWFPKGNKIVSIFSLLDCKYCYDDFCETRECLKAISVENVTKALEEVLSEGK